MECLGIQWLQESQTGSFRNKQLTYIYIPGSSNGLQFLPFQTNLPGGGVGQKICLRAEFSFNNRKHCNAVFLGKMNSGGIARDSGGNTRDSGVNGRNEFFENTKIIFWLKWVRVEFGALGGILSFGQISCLNAFRLKLLPARRSRYIYIILCDIINIYIYIPICYEISDICFNDLSGAQNRFK